MTLSGKKLRYDGTLPMISSVSTTYTHDGVILTEYENEPFIVGDFHHNKIEFMHLFHKKWYSAEPYPYQARLFGYAAVSRPEKVFILGGCCDHKWSLISLFHNHRWSKVGNLKQGRFNMLSIAYHTDILIFGGIANDKKP